MAREYMVVGATPANEECAQVGTENYSLLSRAECHRFIEHIRKVCGVEPEGAVLLVKTEPHDFGSYREVACRYDTEVRESMDYAWHVENSELRSWADVAVHLAKGEVPACGAEGGCTLTLDSPTCFRCAQILKRAQARAAEVAHV